MSAADLPEITADATNARLTAPDAAARPVILDVREPDEWVAGHIAGALHIPLQQLPSRLADIPAERDVIVVCHMGGRSAMATQWLRRQGRARTINLSGGMDAWEGRHLPVETGP